MAAPSPTGSPMMANFGTTRPSASPMPMARLAARRMRWRGQRRVTPPQYLPKTAWMDALEDLMPARGEQSGPVLTGTGGSGGVATATARVLAASAEFADFQPGEILVAPITTPAFTPLFALAAGVIVGAIAVIALKSFGPSDADTATV